MKILLADDEEDSRTAVANFLREAGYEVREAKNGAEALALYKTVPFEMVLSDLRMPQLSGIGLLNEIRGIGRKPAPDVVLFTGQGDMGSAIEALRLGAYDFVLKPLNIEEIVALTTRIAEHQSLLQENTALKDHLRTISRRSSGLDEIGFFSPAMKHLAEQALRYHADRSIPVLIQGETGTGKEILARLIHYGKDGSEAPFVAINCAAITPSLFESELFGYEGGSFTGGRSQGQKGKLDLADGGTLLLDEIGELPLDMQAKLLRVVESRTFFRVGGLNQVKTNIRLIGATNQVMEEKVRQGHFRRDLYFRLKVGLLEILPLRQRPEDIVDLANLFLLHFSRKKKKEFLRLAPETRKLLLLHEWPGNIRELRNTVEWAVFMHDDEELKPCHLPAEIFNAVSSLDIVQAQVMPKETFDLDRHIHGLVSQALQIHDGNKKRTAEYLQISRRNLYTYLKHMNRA